MHSFKKATFGLRGRAAVEYALANDQPLYFFHDQVGWCKTGHSAAKAIMAHYDAKPDPRGDVALWVYYADPKGALKLALPPIHKYTGKRWSDTALDYVGG